MKLIFSTIAVLITSLLFSQENTNQNKFKQLYDELPTPNVYRTASGAPGHMYWQQQADYDIEVRLDEDNQVIYGEETITYFNNSPDALEYLWVQLDQNRRSMDSDSYKIRQSALKNEYSLQSFQACRVFRI